MGAENKYRKQVQKITQKAGAENNPKKQRYRKQVQKTSAENKCRKQITNN